MRVCMSAFYVRKQMIHCAGTLSKHSRTNIWLRRWPVLFAIYCAERNKTLQNQPAWPAPASRPQVLNFGEPAENHIQPGERTSRCFVPCRALDMSIPSVRYADLVFQPDLRAATRDDGAKLSLTRQERALILQLTERPHQLITRQQLLEGLGDLAGELSERNIDYLVNRLRKRLGDNARTPRFIATQYGEGYIWVADPIAVAPVSAFLLIGPVYGLGENEQAAAVVKRLAATSARRCTAAARCCACRNGGSSRRRQAISPIAWKSACGPKTASCIWRWCSRTAAATRRSGRFA